MTTNSDRESAPPRRFSSNDRRLTLLAGGRGATVTRHERVDGRIRVEVLASRRAAGGIASIADALGATLADAGLRGVHAPLIVGEVLTHAQLIGIPAARESVTRKLLQSQLSADETFVSAVVGELKEGASTLTAHFTVAAVREDLRRVAAAADDRGTAVSEVQSLDRILMEFARERAGAVDDGLRIVAVLEPNWIHLVCVAGGRALFVRRVETPSDLAASDRAGAVVAEAQKTALVIRGRLRPPPLSIVVVVDPLLLVPAEALREASEAVGVPFESDAFAITVTPDVDGAALGDAVRAALADEVRIARADKACRLECPTRTSRNSGRKRTVAVASLLVVAWGSAWGVRTRLLEETTLLQTARTGAETDPAAADALRGELARASSEVDAFNSENGALLRYVAAAGPVAPLLRRIAACAPPEAAFTKIDVLPPREGSPLRRIRTEGFVRGGLSDVKPALAALRAALQCAPDFAGADPPAFDRDPFAASEEAPERRICPFVLTTHWRQAPQ